MLKELKTLFNLSHYHSEMFEVYQNRILLINFSISIIVQRV